MPRRAADGIPGTVYAKGGWLYIRTPSGRVVALGLRDTAGNRRTAGRIKRELWLAEMVGTPHTTTTIAKAWERFCGEVNVADRTMRGYEAAYVRIVTDRDAPVTAETLTRFAADFRRSPGSVRFGGVLSPTTINTMLRDYRRFALWCQRVYGLHGVDVSGQMVRAPAPEPVALGRGELERLPDHPLTPLFAFMTCTGARPVDALMLTPAMVKGSVVVWRNKLTKAAEPRPVHVDALQWLPHIYPLQYSKATTYARQWKRATGYRLKDARPTFLSLIRELPWDERVFLMRHHPQGVTERHYLTMDMGKVAERLATVWLPTPRNLLNYKGNPNNS